MGSASSTRKVVDSEDIHPLIKKEKKKKETTSFPKTGNLRKCLNCLKSYHYESDLIESKWCSHTCKSDFELKIKMEKEKEERENIKNPYFSNVVEERKLAIKNEGEKTRKYHKFESFLISQRDNILQAYREGQKSITITYLKSLTDYRFLSTEEYSQTLEYVFGLNYQQHFDTHCFSDDVKTWDKNCYIRFTFKEMKKNDSSSPSHDQDSSNEKKVEEKDLKLD